MFCLIFIAACGNPEAENSAQAENDQETPESIETTTPPQGETKERGSIAVVPSASDGIFEQEAKLEAKLEYEGEFRQGIRWNNGPNLNYLVLAVQQSGNFFEKGWKSELLMYHYLAGTDQPSLQKKYVDKADNIYSAVVLLPEQSKIIDLGNNQKAPLFAYAICPDGEDPCEIHVSSITDGQLYDLKRMSNVDQKAFLSKEKASLEAVPEKLRDPLSKLLFSINLDE